MKKTCVGVIIVSLFVFVFVPQSVRTHDTDWNYFDLGFGGFYPSNGNRNQSDDFDGSLALYLFIRVVDEQGDEVIVFDSQGKGLGMISVLPNAFQILLDLRSLETGEALTVNIYLNGHSEKELSPILIGVKEISATNRRHTVSILRFWVGHHPELRARALNIDGKSAMEIAQHLFDEFNIDVIDCLHILHHEAFDVFDIFQALHDVFHMDIYTIGETLFLLDTDVDETVDILTQLDATYLEIAQILTEFYGFDFDEVSDILFLLGITITDFITVLGDLNASVLTIGSLLKTVFELDVDTTTFALDQAGYEGEDIIEIMYKVYNLSCLQIAMKLWSYDSYSHLVIAAALHEVTENNVANIIGCMSAAGWNIEAIGEILLNVFDLDAYQAGQVLVQAGYNVQYAAQIMVVTYELNAAKGSSVLAYSGYSAVEVMQALKLTYHFNNYVNSSILIYRLGYSEHDLASALKSVYSINDIQLSMELTRLGMTPFTIAQIFKDTLGYSAHDVIAYVSAAGWHVKVVGQILQSLYGYNANQAISTMAQAGYASVWVGHVLYHVYHADADLAVFSMASSNYTSQNAIYVLQEYYQASAYVVGNLIMNYYNLTVEETSALLSNAGYSSDDIWDWMITIPGISVIELAELAFLNNQDIDVILELLVVNMDIEYEAAIEAVINAGFEVSDVLDWLVETTSWTSEQITSFMIQMLIKLGKTIDSVMDWAVDTLGLEKTIEIALRVADTVKAGVDNIMAWFMEGMDDIWSNEDLKLVIKIGMTLSLAVEPITLPILNWIIEVEEWTVEQVLQLVSEISELELEDILPWAVSKLSQMGKSASEVALVLKQFGVDIAEVVASLLRDAGYAALDVANALKNVLDASIDQITSILSDVYGMTQEAVGSILERIGYTAQAIYNAIGNVFGTVGSWFASWFD